MRISSAVDRVLTPRWRRDYQISVAVLVSVGTALTGAALGLLPDAFDSSRRSATTVAWVVSFSALGVLALVLAGLAWRARQLWVTKNGTAFVIREFVRGWQRDDFEVFLDKVRRRRMFGTVLEVFGPQHRGDDWTELKDQGVLDWDTRVEQVVDGFIAARHNDDHSTADSIFVCTPGGVAIACAYRLLTQIRNLQLTVWQRPSSGGGGRITTDEALRNEPHVVDDNLLSIEEAASTGDPGKCRGTSIKSDGVDEVVPGALTRYQWRHRITTIKLESHTADRPCPYGPVPASTPCATIVVLRITNTPWGPLKPRRPSDDPVEDDTLLLIEDRSRAGLHCGTAIIHEWTLLYGAGKLPWEDYRSVADECIDYLDQTLKCTKDSAPVLLTVHGPNELQFLFGARLRLRPGGGEIPRLYLPFYETPTERLVLPQLTMQGR